MVETYSVIGIMSGTSLDGVDLAFCEFSLSRKKWTYRIVQAETLPYPDEWTVKLRALETGSAAALARTHHELGCLYGKMAALFIRKHRLNPDFISSHGHTIFHRPDQGFTTQIGSGAAIAATCKLPVICDFRTLDVSLGGQGAPLVPIGDRLLFPEFSHCLNIGGFANISYEKKGKRIAYDVCPANIVLNELAGLKGKTYDKDGKIARSGTLDQGLLGALNALGHYKQKGPRSLGREWLVSEFLPLLNNSGRKVADLMATVTEHIALQTGRAINGEHKGPVLVTGGGAHNTFLTERLRAHCRSNIIIPDATVVDFKEALIFAFLGVLRWRNENNCLRSVTGAKTDNCGGAVYAWQK